MRLRGPVGLSLVLALCAAARADEDPAAVVQRVVKDLGKLDSYRVEFEIDGGQAEGSEHRVVGNRVSRRWTAETWKGLTSIDGGAAWRPRANGTGAIKDGMVWRSILATDEGRLLERLFVRPEEVLARVQALRKKARWAPLEAGGQAAVAAALAAVEDEDEDEPQGDGAGEGTREKRKAGAKSKRPAKPKPGDPTTSSHRVVVEGPPQVALEQFTALQNSGCFEAG